MQLVNQEEEEEEEEDDEENYTMLNVEEGDENSKPFYIEWSLHGNRFTIMIGSGLPVTIFALGQLNQSMKRDKLQVGNMIKSERYVDFNGKQLIFSGYVFCERQLGDRYIKKSKDISCKKSN